MKNILNLTSKARLHQCLVIGVFLIATLAVSAQAADRSGREGNEQRGRPSAADRNWNEHEGRAHRYWHRPNYRPEPGVIYAPPMVYAPPPEYESPGFNLIVPLHIN